MAIRSCERLQGDPDVFLPALQRAESAGAEGDGFQSGSGPRGVPQCASIHRRCVRSLLSLKTVILLLGFKLKKSMVIDQRGNSVNTFMFICMESSEHATPQNARYITAKSHLCLWLACHFT